MSAANSLSSPASPERAWPAAAPDRDLLSESPATLDLFALGHRAARTRDARFAGRASFARTRQWLEAPHLGDGPRAAARDASGEAADGTWRGPRDASEPFAELAALAPDTGWARAIDAGATLLVGAVTAELHRAVLARGARVLYRFPFRAGEPPAERRARLSSLCELVDGGAALWGVMPTPLGEAEGIDTLRVVAALRLDLPAVAHVVLDVAALGARLAQMALGFGGDELWGPIVSERALRLGGNAGNPALTRKEAAVLIRGAGLEPRERIGPERYAEVEA